MGNSQTYILFPVVYVIFSYATRYINASLVLSCTYLYLVYLIDGIALKFFICICTSQKNVASNIFKESYK